MTSDLYIYISHLRISMNYLDSRGTVSRRYIYCTIFLKPIQLVPPVPPSPMNTALFVWARKPSNVYRYMLEHVSKEPEAVEPGTTCGSWEPIHGF